MKTFSRTSLFLVSLVVLLSLAVQANAALTWVVKSSFLDPRTGSGIEGGCASLIGGSIYVSHGYRFGDSALLSSYDIGTDMWTHGGVGLPDAGIIRSEMAGGTALGKHYAIGGRTGPSDAVEEFDPGTGFWTLKAPMPGGPRGGVGAGSFADMIYVVGGRLGATFGGGPILATCEVYDAGADVWFPLAPMPIPISDNYATIAVAGKVYVFGGATGPGTVIGDTQIYDIANNSWGFGAPMPTARGAAMAGEICGIIAVFGGFDGVGNLSVTEFYDPATDTWAPGPPLAIPVSEMAQGMTTDLAGGEIYSIGSGIFGPSETVVQALTGSCPVVQVEASTWGKIKATYR